MNKNITSIVFFGTPDFAVPSLEALIKNTNYQVSAVVTQPDKPAGRGRNIKQSPVKLVALENNITILEPNTINEEFINSYKSLQADLAVVVAYGKILPDPLLSIPKFGFINVHPSLLPKYRGSSPMQTAILNGDTSTGVSIMVLDKKMDHGPILLQEEVKLDSSIILPTLHDKMALQGSGLLIQALDGFITGGITPTEQFHGNATFTKLIQKESGSIDWTQDVVEIDARIRAFTGWPGAYSLFQDKKIEITKASILEKTIKNKQPGLVVSVNNDVIVECGIGKLRLEIVKLAGKKQMLVQDFVRGRNDFIGAILG